MKWQEVVALVIVVGAAAYLVRGMFKGGEDGGCKGCPKR